VREAAQHAPAPVRRTLRPSSSPFTPYACGAQNALLPIAVGSMNIHDVRDRRQTASSPIRGGGIINRNFNMHMQLTLNCRKGARIDQTRSSLKQRIFQGLFCSRSEIGHRNISASSAAYKNSFFPRTVPEWNSLDKDIAEAPSLSCFKSRLP